MGTEDRDYAERLQRLEGAWWRRALDVQRPYRWNLRRLVHGRVLDVGCGVGRNLAWLGSDAVGVDHNEHSVAIARSRGYLAYMPDEFRASGDAVPASYGTLLLAHVAEHMTRTQSQALIAEYLPYVAPGGRLVLVCPQERGFASDPTHVEFLDFPDLAQICEQSGATVGFRRSFPLPRWAGRWFTYNEFVVCARLAAAASRQAGGPAPAG